LDEEQRAANLRDAVLHYWGKSQLLQRQLAQARASSIKDYLVERGALADERIYLLDVGLGQAQADGRVATQLHLDSE
jgi:outer membrane protein OmpA-like peptidoglycan-associated protein